MQYKNYKISRGIEINRITFLKVVCFFFFSAIAARLFYLQILKTDEYKTIAKEQYYSDIVIPPRRGEILSIDYKTNKYNKLATNTTLDLLYIDPTEIPDKRKVAELLAPLIFTQEDYQNCKKDLKLCPQGNVVEFNTPYVAENFLPAKEIPPEKDARSLPELIKAYEEDIYRKISQKEIEFVPLKYDADPKTLSGVSLLNLSGVYANPKNSLIYVNPTEIPGVNLKYTAQQLSPLVNIPYQDLYNLLQRRDVRYVPLKRRIAPEISDQIWELKFKFKDGNLKNPTIPNYFKGVVLLPEHWRYYPDGELASQVVGFVNHEGIGQYGIEGNYNIELQGQKGHNISQKDVFGTQVTMNEKNDIEAIDGASIILTIDRVVQQKVEEILKAATQKTKADSAQVIIIDPFTGRIIAMANSPSFDPNSFGDVYKKRKLKKNERVPATIRVFIKDEKENYRLAEKSERDNLLLDRYIFENWLGEGAYLNKTVQETYEPGSVFKPLIMAAALEAGEVTPQTKYLESGPLEVETGTDEKQYIHTALNVYRGWQTMTNVLETSSNIGMAFVSKKLGRTLMYKYIKDFGFGEMTDIELEGEEPGTVTHYKKWPLAQLYNISFGQGVSMTPLQMATAWCALANGGLLMQPHIVDSVIDNSTGKIEKVEPEVIRRVITADTSSTITAMLVSSVKNGVAKAGGIKGYKVAGKTGTAQIAKSTGVGYEKGVDGNTITSFVGYSPVGQAKFLIVVKFDRPRLGPQTWGENTAAPVFRDVATFLLDYYDLPPDDQ